MVAALVPAGMGVYRTWAPGFAVGQPPHMESHPAYSYFTELMAKLEKHKGEEEEEQQHSDHAEDPQ